MIHWLILTSILGVTAGQNIAAPLIFGTCSYTGDPHLIPFPSSPGKISNMYYCQSPGWQIVLLNKWVLIAVKVSSSPFVILDYTVMFFNADLSLACVLIGSSGYSTCSASSPVISITNLGGTSWTHIYPAAEFLSVQISSYIWLGGVTRYDFFIRETYHLIDQSIGVCVKYNSTCTLEEILQPPPPPIIVKICGIYIAAAQQRLIGRVDEKTVGFITIACENDVILTANTQFGHTAVATLIHASLAQVSSDNYQAEAAKAEQNIQAANQAADRLVAPILTGGNTCSQQPSCLTNGNQ